MMSEEIVQVKVTEDSLSVELERSYDIRSFQRLVHGNPAERVNVEISGAGLRGLLALTTGD